MKLSSIDNKLGLKTLVALQSARWLDFYTKLEKFASNIGFSVKAGDKFSDFEITAADFASAGFTADEAAALVFIVADGADDLDGIDGWLIANRKSVAFL